MGTGLKLESSEYMNYQIDKNDDYIRSSHRTFFKLMINGGGLVHCGWYCPLTGVEIL